MQTRDNRHGGLDATLAGELIENHRAAQAAAAAAKAERAERERAERQQAAAIRKAENEARQARAARQREIIADNPGITAYEAMRMAADDDTALAAAGRRFDMLMQQERHPDREHVAGYSFHQKG